MGRMKCCHDNLVQMETGLLGCVCQGCQPQCAGATDEPFSQAANLVTLLDAHDMMDALAGSLDNLVLTATSNRTTVQQPTLANLSLMTSVATLRAANKKLTKTITRCNLAPQGCGGGS